MNDLPGHYREILSGVGENPEREGLRDTPQRAAKAMQYLCGGYNRSLEEIVNGALFASDNDEMISHTGWVFLFARNKPIIA